jgi:hypothetical protein
MGQPAEKTYMVVLVPADQVTGDGCKPGFVKLTGTPDEGDWEQWGPYRRLGQVDVGLDELQVVAAAYRPSSGEGGVTSGT